MKKMLIEHFLGKSICVTIDDVLKTLEQSVDGVNEFYMSQECMVHPYLAVLINGSYAYVSYVPTDDAAGFQAFSDSVEIDLNPDGISVFYINTPSEEIEIDNTYVIPKTLAVQIVKEFAETGTMSNCVEWEEL